MTVLLLGGGNDHKYKLLFQTGGSGEVLGADLGGSPAGSVDSIDLTDNNQAEVAIKAHPLQPWHQGTTVIRATSLSGVANDYISITPGPDNSRP